MAKKLKVCHDRVLPQDLLMTPPEFRIAPPGGTRAAGMPRVRAILPDFRKLWINGSTLRVFFMGGTASQRKKATAQALWWSEHANLNFQFVDTPDAEIRISFDPNDGAWSYIGTDCKKIPRNQATMNLGFMDGGTAAHEFGHAIGLGHEHQNPAGGIEWKEDVVIRELGGPPNNWNPDEVRHNVLQKYSSNFIRGTKFDPDSIMLYFFPGRWTKSGRGTKANETISAQDIAFIKSSQAYPRTTITATELKVNGKLVAEKIGKPGEEDLFTFTVAKAGRHIISTSGKTDVVMKLYGPNSQTSLIAEDDDSGVGMNARIVADLVPGEYFVQIRHFNRAKGTGEYKVRVKSAA